MSTVSATAIHQFLSNVRTGGLTRWTIGLLLGRREVGGRRSPPPPPLSRRLSLNDSDIPADLRAQCSMIRASWP